MTKRGESTTLAKREEGVQLDGLPPSLAEAIQKELAGGSDPLEMAIASWAEVELAKTAEDILGGANAVSSKDFTGHPFYVQGFRLWPSAFAGQGPRVFGSIEAVHAETGEAIIVNTSNVRAIVALLGAKVKGWLPLTFPVVFQQADHPTAAGFFPVILRRFEEPDEA